jgi:hypothetical protein
MVALRVRAVRHRLTAHQANRPYSTKHLVEVAEAGAARGPVAVLRPQVLMAATTAVAAPEEELQPTVNCQAKVVTVHRGSQSS